ncbi:tetratricopeptide repeat protein [Halanaerobium saccharolyticum]|uniref:tetratricopeptide repeat protein n=1 Tax=Halanaerobium saccharolyticum TaxID=43595 RepID=UPI003FCE1F34
MFKKIFLLVSIFLFLSSSFLVAAEPTLEEIQSLIAAEKNEQALKLLKENDLSGNPDLKFYQALLLSWQEDYPEAEKILIELIDTYPKRLDFYDQLARIYGWQRKFDQAAAVINKAQAREYSPERTALLAQHARWQNRHFEAEKLLEEALQKTELENLEAEYQRQLKEIREEIKPLYFLEGRTVYSEADKEELSVNLGLEKPLKDGLEAEFKLGSSYFQQDFNFLLSAGFDFKPPLTTEKIDFSSKLNYYQGESRDYLELNNSFNYHFKPKNRLGINLNFREARTDYQSLELEYEYQFAKNSIVLKNISRHYDSGWTADFAQKLNIYLPRANYLLNLSLSRYQDEEKVVKVAFEFSDLFSRENYSLRNLNFWFNDQKTANLDFRLDLK